MDLEPKKMYVYLTPGTRIPQIDAERALLEEVEEIEKDGYTAEIPSKGI